MRTQVQSLALLRGLRIQHCYELWCRSQMQLRSDIAVAVAQASGYSSDLTPSLGTNNATGVTLKRQTNKQTKNQSGYRQIPGWGWVEFVLKLHLRELYSTIINDAKKKKKGSRFFPHYLMKILSNRFTLNIQENVLSPDLVKIHVIC